MALRLRVADPPSMFRRGREFWIKAIAEFERSKLTPRRSRSDEGSRWTCYRLRRERQESVRPVFERSKLTHEAFAQRGGVPVDTLRSSQYVGREGMVKVVGHRLDRRTLDVGVLQRAISQRQMMHSHVHVPVRRAPGSRPETVPTTPSPADRADTKASAGSSIGNASRSSRRASHSKRTSAWSSVSSSFMVILLPQYKWPVLRRSLNWFAPSR